MYDLRTDPGESHNRIDDPAMAETLAAMKDRLLIKYISEKHFNEINSMDIEMIKKDPGSAYYTGILKVVLR